MNFTVIDFETANWYRSSACSIGIVKVDNFEIVDRFYSLIKPTPFFFANINKSITKLSESDVENAPDFKELWPQIKHYFNDQIVAAHNFPFDHSVLSHLARTYEFDYSLKNGVCTLYASKVAFPNLDSYKLPNIIEKVLGKKFDDHHNALSDALITAELLIHIYKSWQPPSVNGMINALYESPLEKRFILTPNSVSFSKINYSKLVPDIGYEDKTNLKGKCFVLTGELNNFTRFEAAQLITNFGGTLSTTLTKKSTHLLIGNLKLNSDTLIKTGKLADAEKAIENGQDIKIMYEVDFIEMIKRFTN